MSQHISYAEVERLLKQNELDNQYYKTVEVSVPYTSTDTVNGRESQNLSKQRAIEIEQAGEKRYIFNDLGRDYEPMFLVAKADELKNIQEIGSNIFSLEQEKKRTNNIITKLGSEMEGIARDIQSAHLKNAETLISTFFKDNTSGMSVDSHSRMLTEIANQFDRSIVSAVDEVNLRRDREMKEVLESASVRYREERQLSIRQEEEAKQARVQVEHKEVNEVLGYVPQVALIKDKKGDYSLQVDIIKDGKVDKQFVVELESSTLEVKPQKKADALLIDYYQIKHLDNINNKSIADHAHTFFALQESVIAVNPSDYKDLGFYKERFDEKSFVMNAADKTSLVSIVSNTLKSKSMQEWINDFKESMQPQEKKENKSNLKI